MQVDKNFPIQHLSYSACRQFYTSPAKFAKFYINKERMENTPMPMAIGSAWHKGLEELFKGNKDYVQEGVKYFENAASEIEGYGTDEFDFAGYKKNMEALVRNLEQYTNEERAWEPHPEMIEVKAGMPCPHEGGFPMVAIMDVISKETATPVDHKYVSAYSSDPRKYYVQGWFQYHLTHHITGVYPEVFIISEFKKSKNRDGSPQLREMVIPYQEKWLKNVGKWYVATSQQIYNQMYFMPNPFAQYGTDDWNDFLEL